MCYNTGNEEKQKVHGTLVWHIAKSSQEMTAARHVCGYGTQELKKPKGIVIKLSAPFSIRAIIVVLMTTVSL